MHSIKGKRHGAKFVHIHIIWKGIGVLLYILSLQGCQREALDRIAPDGNGDNFMGYYTLTELGGKLMPPPSLNDINGYTDKISYEAGQSINFFLSAPTSGIRQLNVTNVNNDRNILSFTTNIPTQILTDKKPWENGFGYSQTFTARLPSQLKPGIYYLNGTIPFICKNKSKNHDLTVVYPSNTLNAYNWTGGKSLYAPDHENRATVVSFLRPLSYPLGYDGAGFLRWIEKQQYDANYICDEDLDQFEEIRNSKMVIIIGHSEYWSRNARINLDKFVESGRNVLILSGNTMWWQVRYNQSKHLMICYKDSVLDPLQNPLFKTINWYWPNLQFSILQSIGADFRFGGYGDHITNRWNGYKITKANSPILENTGLNNGDILELPSHEYDGTPLVKMLLPGSSEIPVVNNTLLNFFKIELLGYDFAEDGHLKGVGTFIVFQKRPSSGTVVNVATMNWCTPGSFNGNNKDRIIQITGNMINKTLAGHSLFSN